MNYFHDIKNFSRSKFIEVDFRIFFYLEKTPVDIYHVSPPNEIVKKKNDTLEKEFFINLIKNNQTKLLVDKHLRHLINERIFNEITTLGRKISQFNPIEFSKRIIHFIFVQHSEIQLTPLNEKLINNQITSFKIWLTFLKKLTPNQFQQTIKYIHQLPNGKENKKALVGATLLYYLSNSESIFTEHYCFNLALSGFFCEIGTSLFSKEQKQKSAITNAKVFKYSGLILSLKTDLPDKNINILNASSEILSEKKNDILFGQETYYFLASYIICENIFPKKTFSIKKELTEIKDMLPNGFKNEFRKMITWSQEFFGWEQLPDQITQ